MLESHVNNAKTRNTKQLSIFVEKQWFIFRNLYNCRNLSILYCIHCFQDLNGVSEKFFVFLCRIKSLARQTYFTTFNYNIHIAWKVESFD